MYELEGHPAADGAKAEPSALLDEHATKVAIPVQLQLGRLSEQARGAEPDGWHQKKTGQLCRVRERR